MIYQNILVTEIQEPTGLDKSAFDLKNHLISIHKSRNYKRNMAITQTKIIELVRFVDLPKNLEVTLINFLFWNKKKSYLY